MFPGAGCAVQGAGCGVGGAVCGMRSANLQKHHERQGQWVDKRYGKHKMKQHIEKLNVHVSVV